MASEPIPGLRLAFLLSKFRSPGKRQLLDGGIEHWRRLEGLVDPHKQIAIDEQLLAQQRREIRQAPAEAGTQLQILEQEQGDQRRPDLDLQGVGAGAHESLDAQILFQRLEEQLDLPALAVDGSDGGSSEAAMIGEKHTRARFCSSSHTSMRRRNKSRWPPRAAL